MATKNETVIPISELRPGIVLPCPIFDGNNPNLLLLGQGTRITRMNLQRLRERGVSKVSVDSRHAAAVSGQNNLAEQRRKKAQQQAEQARKQREAESRPLRDQMKPRPAAPPSAVKVREFKERQEQQKSQMHHFYERIQQSMAVDGKLTQDITRHSLEAMMDDLDLFVKLSLDPSDGDEAYEHCFRVSQLSVSVATIMGHSKADLVQLGMGCLLSRIGLTAEALRLQDLDRPLSRVERLELEKCPINTFDMLADLPDVPVGSRQVAYQIYERWDGSGYPRQRVGSQIHPLARIASVCDVYVALTSDRPHRDAYLPYFAVEQILEQTKKGKFDPRVIRGLLQTVSLFPLGSYVELNDGRIANVLRTNPDHFGKPVITIMCDTNLLPIEPVVVSMADDDTLEISRALGPEDIEDWKCRLPHLDLETKPVQPEPAEPRLPEIAEAKKQLQFSF